MIFLIVIKIYLSKNENMIKYDIKKDEFMIYIHQTDELVVNEKSISIKRKCSTSEKMYVMYSFTWFWKNPRSKYISNKEEMESFIFLWDLLHDYSKIYWYEYPIYLHMWAGLKIISMWISW